MAPAGSESKRIELETGGRRAPESTTVRYFAAGEGPPLVLVHGVGLDAAGISWKHVIPELAGEFRVLAPDLPGHGESDKPDVRYTTDYYIDVLSSFVDELGLPSFSLGGISMGGGIALGYALENERAVDRLVLVDSYGLGADAIWRPAASVALRTPFGKLLWQTMGINEGTVRDTLRGYVTRASEEFVAEVYEAIQDADSGRALRRWQRSEFLACGFRTCYLDDLEDLTVPTLLLHGADDSLLPSWWSERADERLPDSQLRVFEDCGHWPPRERPTSFNRALASFLAS